MIGGYDKNDMVIQHSWDALILLDVENIITQADNAQQLLLHIYWNWLTWVGNTTKANQETNGEVRRKVDNKLMQEIAKSDFQLDSKQGTLWDNDTPPEIVEEPDSESDL